MTSLSDHHIAIARDQIRNLVATYNNCADRGRIDEFIEVFAPDAILETTGMTMEGKANIEHSIRNIATGKNPDVDLSGSRHQLTTTRIEINDENNAQGWIYFFVSRRGEIIEEGTYIDHYIRLANGWRIAKRRVKMHYTIHNKNI